MTEPINSSLAQLLKEKGYDKVCYGLRDENGMYPHNYFRNSKEDTWNFAAPTIAEVVMWIYERHGAWVVVLPTRKDLGLFWGGYIHYNEEVFAYGSNCPSPSAAYTAAIEHVLKNLI